MATKVKVPVAGTEANSNHAKALIGNEKLRQLYSTMLKCRILDERARILKKQARFKGNYEAAAGQEAVAVGAGVDLRPEDAVALSHRDFISGFIKGVPLTAMFGQWYGRSTSPDRDRSGAAHCGYAPLNIVTAPPASTAQLNIGTGIALAYQMKRNDNVVVAFTDESFASLGSWQGALNFAGVRNLPIVYVCQNSWEEPASANLQTRVDDISLKAMDYGFPGIAVDGNDVVAMYRVAQEAIERARSGGGPTLIEARTYRWYGDFEIVPAKSRTADEVEKWKAKDPIAAMERYLTGKGLFSDAWKKEILDEFQKELDAAIEADEKAPAPGPTDRLDYPYSFDICSREIDWKNYSPQF